MWAWIAATTAASAGVVLEDGGGCLGAAEVESEVRGYVSAEHLDRSELRVRLETTESPWTLTLRAFDEGGELLWRHEAPARPEECSLLPGLIARIAESRYAGVPRWGLPEPRAPAGREFVVELAGTAPDDLHFAFGGGALLPLGGPWQAVVHAEGYLGAAVSLGVDRNGSGAPRSGQFAGLLVGGGLAHQVPAGRFAVRSRGWVQAGPNLGFGHGFDAPNPIWLPRAAASMQIDVVTPFLLRVGGRITVPFVRAAPAPVLQPGAEVPEPWLRMGLVVGVGGAIGDPL